ncbi:MAG TPA: YjbQ family protein [Candidatus Avilachnospira avicola]|nr:YjbQ family protein [Candidatus Avilachnospira avicola]
MIKRDTFYVQTTKTHQYILITEEVERIVENSGIKDGVVFVITNHTTTGITVNEALECLESDFKNFMEKLAPDDDGYSHARYLASYSAMANNAPCHMRSMVAGNHCVFNVIDGKLSRRFAQEIYLDEFDGPQNRSITVTVMGEA